MQAATSLRAGGNRANGGPDMLRRAILSSFCAAAGLAAIATSVSAETFKCPHVGGNFTFGQEANINSLDQMASEHDLDAQHRHEHVRIADDARRELQSDPGTRRFPGGVAGPSDLHVQAASGHPIPQREGTDIGRCGRLVRPLRQDRPVAQHARQCRSLGCAGQGHVRDPSEEGAADLPGDPERLQRTDRHHSGRGQGRSANATQDDRHGSVATGGIRYLAAT